MACGHGLGSGRPWHLVTAVAATAAIAVLCRCCCRCCAAAAAAVLLLPCCCCAAAAAAAMCDAVVIPPHCNWPMGYYCTRTFVPGTCFYIVIFPAVLDLARSLLSRLITPGCLGVVGNAQHATATTWRDARPRSDSPIVAPSLSTHRQGGADRNPLDRQNRVDRQHHQHFNK